MTILTLRTSPALIGFPKGKRSCFPENFDWRKSLGEFVKETASTTEAKNNRPYPSIFTTISKLRTSAAAIGFPKGSSRH